MGKMQRNAHRIYLGKGWTICSVLKRRREAVLIEVHDHDVNRAWKTTKAWFHHSRISENPIIGCKESSQ